MSLFDNSVLFDFGSLWGNEQTLLLTASIYIIRELPTQIREIFEIFSKYLSKLGRSSKVFLGDGKLFWKKSKKNPFLFRELAYLYIVTLIFLVLMENFMSHTSKRKDIVFVKSNLNVFFTDEKIFEKDLEAAEELITAALDSGQTESEVEDKRAEVIEKLIEENKKTRRAIKR